MSRTYSIQSNLGAGEISPRMRGRFDLIKYSNGAGLLMNFLPFLQGGVDFRPGTRHVAPSAAATGDGALVEFAPNSSESFILEFTDLSLRVFDNATRTLVTTLVTPYLSSDLAQLRLTYDVDVMIITHADGKYHPKQLTRAVGSWSLEDVRFTSHPFAKNDSSDTELVVSGEETVIRIDTDNAADWAGLPANLNTSPRWVEYRVDGEYYLARILDGNTSPSAPAPTTTTIYAEPVQSVATGIAKTARFVRVGSSEIEVPAGEFHLRCDTLLFDYDVEDAWIRFRSDYEKVRTASYPDGKVRWARIETYLGQQDYPTKFIAGAGITDADFELGSIYRINEAGAADFTVVVGAPVSGGVTDWNEGFLYNKDGDQFSWDNYASSSYSVHGRGPPTAAPDASTQLDNMSSLRTFDVVKLYTASTPTEGVDLVQPSGNLTILDLETDPTGNARHTATLRSSKAFFGSSADEVGRYYHVRYGDSWVLFKVSARVSDTQVTCDVYDPIPKFKGKDVYVDNGQSGVFRRSIWGPDNWPYCAAFHDSRLAFGGCPSHPNYVSLSKLEDNYDFRTVENDGQVLATTGISAPLQGATLNKIVWMETGPTLLVGTESADWQIRPNTFGEGLSPNNIRITRETGEGSALPALRIGSSVFYVERSRRAFRELVFDFNIDGFTAKDVNVLADHLFESDPIVDFAFQQFPGKILWVVTESGLLFTLTYNAENDFYAWARVRTNDHSGAARVRSVAVAPRNGLLEGEDTLWLYVERDGVNQIEVLTPRFRDDGSDNYKPNMWYLDGATRFPDSGYLGAPVTSVSGLTRFANTEVSVVVDGAMQPTATVDASGVLQLARTANKYVLVGLPYEGELELLMEETPNPNGGSPTFGRKKRIGSLTLFLYKSLGLSYGNRGSTRIVSFRATSDLMDQSPPLFTGVKPDLTMPAGFDYETYVTIKQTQPYPLTLLAVATLVNVEE